MYLVMFSLLFSFVDYVPVKGEIIWYLSLTAIVNCAAMNIGVHRFFWIGVSGFLGYNLSSGIAG